MEVSSPVIISGTNTELYQVHHRYKEKSIFFFSNQNKEEGVRFSASFTSSKGLPWKWDPETGTREVLYYGNDPQNLNIKLNPLESLLLVFENKEGHQIELQEADESNFLTIDSPWSIKCWPHIGSEFQLQTPELFDLASSEDERLNSFAGIIEYTTTVDIDNDTDIILDLGKVNGISEVSINGKLLGVGWYGRHRYSIGGIVGKGKNDIKVKLTTTLYNYCRTQKDNPEIRRWLRTQKPEPSGMVGPVRIYSLKQ